MEILIFITLLLTTAIMHVKNTRVLDKDHLNIQSEWRTTISQNPRPSGTVGSIVVVLVVGVGGKC